MKRKMKKWERNTGSKGKGSAKSWWDRCVPVSLDEDVPVCNLDGTVREVVKVRVSGLRAPDGEICLDGEALAKLDREKARREGRKFTNGKVI